MKQRANLPFVIFTVKETIEDVTQRTNMMEIIQNYYYGKVSTTVISTALFGQISKIVLKVLKENKSKCSKTDVVRKVHGP